MSKHTPGPWAVYTNKRSSVLGDYEQHVIVTHDVGDTIMDNKSTEVSPDEDVANAHLISAAPELYEAAKEAFQHIENIYGANHERGEPHVFKMLRDAIAKAENKNPSKL
jgi:hypothetical protein